MRAAADTGSGDKRESLVSKDISLRLGYLDKQALLLM